MDIVQFLDIADMKARFIFNKKKKTHFRTDSTTVDDESHVLPLEKGAKGQYKDGHKWGDVVTYCFIQNTHLTFLTNTT